jgi:putative SOS response-associated peptidase YedK
MCNLYSVTKPQSAIRELAKAMVDDAGKLPALPAIFPDSMAPVVFAQPHDGQRRLQMLRWAFPRQPLRVLPW